MRNKVLLVNKEIRPGRVTMIIVKEELGYKKELRSQTASEFVTFFFTWSWR